MIRKIDAIVVGLGAAGGIIAAELARAGLRVVALEKGAYYKPGDFKTKFDEIRYYTRAAIVPKMATDPMTWRAGHNETAEVLPWASNKLGLGDPFQIPPSLGTGGGTLNWGAASFRFREADFRMRSEIERRFSAKALPEGHSLVDWPLSYADLEPYYDKVEWELGVGGVAGNIAGEIQDGGNPFEAPRRRGYPMPPLDRSSTDGVFTAAARRLGFHPYPTPTAIATIPYKGRNACTNCGFCHGYPCHVGAKVSTNEIVRAAADETGNLEIRPFSRVIRVNKRRDGRVAGVSYIEYDERIVDIEAPIVILGAYAFENARLLLVSGITGNGHVGQHLSMHNYGWFNGTLPEPTNPYMGSLQAGSVIDDLTSELIPDNDEGVVWGSPINTWAGDLQPLEVVHGIPAHVPKWGPGFKSWLRDSYLHLFRLYSQHSSLPMRQFYCDIDPNVLDPHGQPTLRITHEWTDHDRRAVEYFSRVKRSLARELGMTQMWEDSPTPKYHVTVHDTGTHRMGFDPKASVTDLYGEVHEVPGLFAVGGGQFPSLAPYNPTHTIMALAFMTAEHLISKASRDRLPRVSRAVHSTEQPVVT